VLLAHIPQKRTMGKLG